jgi:hypothetical protein
MTQELAGLELDVGRDREEAAVRILELQVGGKKDQASVHHMDPLELLDMAELETWVGHMEPLGLEAGAGRVSLLQVKASDMAEEEQSEAADLQTWEGLQLANRSQGEGKLHKGPSSAGL